MCARVCGHFRIANSESLSGRLVNLCLRVIPSHHISNNNGQLRMHRICTRRQRHMGCRTLSCNACMVPTVTPTALAMLRVTQAGTSALTPFLVPTSGSAVSCVDACGKDVCGRNWGWRCTYSVTVVKGPRCAPINCKEGSWLERRKRGRGGTEICTKPGTGHSASSYTHSSLQGIKYGKLLCL